MLLLNYEQLICSLKKIQESDFPISLYLYCTFNGRLELEVFINRSFVDQLHGMFICITLLVFDSFFLLLAHHQEGYQETKTLLAEQDSTSSGQLG